MKTKPYPFQLEDVEKIEKVLNGRAVIAHDPGLGKTLSALLFAERNVRGPIVAVVPAVAKISWAREAEKHCNRMVTILSGLKPNFDLLSGPHFWVINYDIIHGRSSPSWAEVLKALKPELIIFDECQMLQEASTKRSKASRYLAEGVKYVLGLSGTPMVNRPINLWHPLSIIKPGLFPSRYSYGMRYCAGTKCPFGGWDFTGASNLRELHGILDKYCMVRRRKEDVLRDLPKLSHYVVPLEMSKAASRLYAKAENDFGGWLKAKMVREGKILPKDISMLMLTKQGHLRRLAATLKLGQTVEWIDDFLTGSDKKLVVFGVHKEKVLHPIYEHFKNQAVLITGEVTGSKRQAAIDRFNNDPNCRLNVCNIQAGGVAWSCTSADDVAFVEYDSIPGNHAQAWQRVSGISRGTGNPVSVWWLTGVGTIEENLAHILQKKSKNINEAIDGRKISTLSVHDWIAQELLKKNLQPRKVKR